MVIGPEKVPPASSLSHGGATAHSTPPSSCLVMVSRWGGQGVAVFSKLAGRSATRFVLVGGWGSVFIAKLVGLGE